MARCKCEYCKERRKRNSKVIIVKGFSQDCSDYEIKLESPWAGFYAFCVTAAILIFIAVTSFIIKNWRF